MVFHANSKQKKVKEAILISNKAYFKIKTVIGDEEGHNVKINGTIQREDRTTIDISIYLYIHIYVYIHTHTHTYTHTHISPT